jgi:hypothetical protein
MNTLKKKTVAMDIICVKDKNHPSITSNPYYQQ